MLLLLLLLLRKCQCVNKKWTCTQFEKHLCLSWWLQWKQIEQVHQPHNSQSMIMMFNELSWNMAIKKIARHNYYLFIPFYSCFCHYQRIYGTGLINPCSNGWVRGTKKITYFIIDSLKCTIQITMEIRCGSLRYKWHFGKATSEYRHKYREQSTREKKRWRKKNN